jgi:hypothetical protein
MLTDGPSITTNFYTCLRDTNIGNCTLKFLLLCLRGTNIGKCTLKFLLVCLRGTNIGNCELTFLLVSIILGPIPLTLPSLSYTNTDGINRRSIEYTSFYVAKFSVFVPIFAYSEPGGDVMKNLAVSDRLMLTYSTSTLFFAFHLLRNTL